MPLCGNCKTFKGTPGEIRAHMRADCSVDPRWKSVVVFKAIGQDGKARRLRKKILGVSKPMSDEAKLKLKAWNEAHKDEIRERAKLRRRFRKAAMASAPQRRSANEERRRARSGRHRADQSGA